MLFIFQRNSFQASLITYYMQISREARAQHAGLAKKDKANCSAKYR